MTILTPVNQEMEASNTVPYAWGYEDAVNGDDNQGSSYFLFEDLDHYYEGYAAGLAKRQADETAPVVLDEIAFFEQALTAFRNGDVKSLAKLPDSVIEEIEDEEIGRIFCTHPSYRAW